MTDKRLLIPYILASEGLEFADWDVFAAAFDARMNITGEYLSQNPYAEEQLSLDLSRLDNVSGDKLAYTEKEASALYCSLYSEICKCLSAPDEGDMPQLYIVERFPSPFDSRPWKAMCVDYALGSHENVKAGIYYKPEYLFRGMFEVMISHEILHHILSKYSKGESQLYTSLMEEGACEILSSYALLSIDSAYEPFVRQYLVHNRAGVRDGSARYHYFRAALWLLDWACENGMDALLGRIRDGRAAFTAFDFDSACRPCPQTGALSRLQCLYGRASRMEVLPLSEYLLFKKSAQKVVLPLSDLAELCHMTSEQASARLLEMQGRGLLSAHGGKVYNYNSHLLPNLYYN